MHHRGQQLPRKGRPTSSRRSSRTICSTSSASDAPAPSSRRRSNPLAASRSSARCAGRCTTLVEQSHERPVHRMARSVPRTDGTRTPRRVHRVEHPSGRREQRVLGAGRALGKRDRRQSDGRRPPDNDRGRGPHRAVGANVRRRRRDQRAAAVPALRAEGTRSTTRSWKEHLATLRPRPDRFQGGGTTSRAPGSTACTSSDTCSASGHESDTPGDARLLPVHGTARTQPWMSPPRPTTTQTRARGRGTRSSWYSELDPYSIMLYSSERSRRTPTRRGSGSGREQACPPPTSREARAWSDPPIVDVGVSHAGNARDGPSRSRSRCRSRRTPRSAGLDRRARPAGGTTWRTQFCCEPTDGRSSRSPKPRRARPTPCSNLSGVCPPGSIRAWQTTPDAHRRRPGDQRAASRASTSRSGTASAQLICRCASSRPGRGSGSIRCPTSGTPYGVFATSSSWSGQAVRRDQRRGGLAQLQHLPGGDVRRRADRRSSTTRSPVCPTCPCGSPANRTEHTGRSRRRSRARSGTANWYTSDVTVTSFDVQYANFTDDCGEATVSEDTAGREYHLLREQRGRGREQHRDGQARHRPRRRSRSWRTSPNATTCAGATRRSRSRSTATTRRPVSFPIRRLIAGRDLPAL